MNAELREALDIRNALAVEIVDRAMAAPLLGGHSQIDRLIARYISARKTVDDLIAEVAGP